MEENKKLKKIVDKENRKADKSYNKGRLKILAVDDQFIIIESFKLILGTLANVKCAVNANQALSILKKEKFDLLTTGINGPRVLEGLFLLECIKGKYPKMKRIVISAVIDPKVIKTAKEYGASKYIIKPFNVKEIFALAKRIARERGRVIPYKELANNRKENTILHRMLECQLHGTSKCPHLSDMRNRFSDDPSFLSTISESDLAKNVRQTIKDSKYCEKCRKYKYKSLNKAVRI